MTTQMKLPKVVLFRMQQSNCLVGVVESKDEKTWYLSAVAVVRRWGTTQGFPELCKGPVAEKTILDFGDLPDGELAEVEKNSIHYTLPAHPEPWLKAFAEASGR